VSTVIQPKALAVIVRPADGRYLIHEGENATGGRYARPLGGSIEFGELAIDALRREILEELGSGITDVVLIGVFENRFELNSIPGHEVIFAFRCELKDRRIYERQEIPILDVPGSVATWWSPVSGVRFVPDELWAAISS
jgi:ADP-ribose pyrophosphatase YjhB (NUDIX family)